MRGRNLLSIADLSPSQFDDVLTTAMALKDAAKGPILAGKTLALVFEKPSLRTRVSFHVAMKHLGGDCIYLSPPEVGLGQRETPGDVARVLSRYVDVIAARTFTQETSEIRNTAAFESTSRASARNSLVRERGNPGPSRSRLSRPPGHAWAWGRNLPSHRGAPGSRPDADGIL